jgi:hypothetical protein
MLYKPQNTLIYEWSSLAYYIATLLVLVPLVVVFEDFGEVRMLPGSSAAAGYVAPQHLVPSKSVGI